jgi:phage-related minor tail protein
MAVIGNLVANLVADTSGFTQPMVQAQSTIQDVGRSVQRSGSIASGVFSGLAKFSVAAMAFRSVTSSISGMVSGAIDAQKSGAKLDAVLASTGGAAGVSGEEIRKLASDLQLVTDFEDDATVAAAGVLATFTQVKGDVFKDAIVSAQDLSAVMGQDLQSSVVQIGKALNDPIKGITALSRVGVSFTEQQKQQITQMAKAGDIAGAQAMILRELQTEFGGAAEAMSSPFTRIGNIVGDIGEGIGAVFLPALEAVASRIADGILPVAESMCEGWRCVA